ncbi:MAG: trigger factor [Candidatus Falkowbacteria bacterium]|nr:trigger factor [Candidatus Falkowbacteria bacterium]
MQVTKNNISASRVELLVSVSTEEMTRFAKQAATHLSEHNKIEGFRPGKAPYDVIKDRLGEMAIAEEASRMAVAKTIDAAIKENIGEDWIGQPEITITKLVPNSDFEYKALVTLLPSVKLGKYKELKLSKEKVVVDEKEVTKVIDHLRESRVKEVLVERAAEENDKVVIDVNMLLDKVPVDGGQGKDVVVVIGKDYFVPGFDKNLIGLKSGDEKSFSVHYPADHHLKNLSGKEVDFTVKIKDVFARELPELNDDFLNAFGLKSETELKENIKKSLEHEKEHELDNKFEREMLEKIINDSEISELPEVLIENESEIMLRELEYNVNAQGGKFADYMTGLNKTPEMFKQEFLPQAKERVKASLILRNIIKIENIVVSDEEVEKEVTALKKQYAHDPKALETIGSLYYHRHIESSLLNRKAITNLLAWNVIDK